MPFHFFLTGYTVRLENGGGEGEGVNLLLKQLNQLRVMSCIVKYNRSVEILELNVLNNFCAV